MALTVKEMYPERTLTKEELEGSMKAVRDFARSLQDQEETPAPIPNKE